MTIPVFKSLEQITKLTGPTQAHQELYRAMYATWYGGIVTDPRLMLVPIDDHMVHRGDGIFEAMKCVRSNIYAMKPHLERLQSSSEAVSLKLPMLLEQIEQIAIETVRASKLTDCLIRLYVSRGPGSFSPNPFESIGSQLYLVVTVLKKPDPAKYERGVSVIMSQIPIKEGVFPTIKSCNYLPNVLMKKESVEKGSDFAVGLDNEGFITEGPTENIGFVFNGNELVIPRFRKTLRGITVSRVMELAKNLGSLFVHEGDVTIAKAHQASEILMFGTTLDVLPVTTFAGQKVGTGVPGPWAKRLLDLLRSDMAAGDFSSPV